MHAESEKITKIYIVNNWKYHKDHEIQRNYFLLLLINQLAHFPNSSFLKLLKFLLLKFFAHFDKYQFSDKMFHA